MIERWIHALVKWLVKFLPNYNVHIHRKRKRKEEIPIVKSGFDELAGE